MSSKSELQRAGKLPLSLLLSAASITLTIAASQTANAQQAGAQGLILEEIVVTARLYEESLQNAPLAVAVITDDYLSNQKIETIDEMMRLVPGASFANFSKLQPNITLRGVNSATPGNASLEASIQMVVDGFVNSRDSMKAAM